MTTPTWQAATPGYPTYAGQVNQFLAAHPSYLSYVGSAPTGTVDPTSLTAPVSTDNISTTSTSGAGILGALGQSFTVSSATTLTYLFLALKKLGSGCDLLVTIQPGNGAYPSGTTTATSVGGCGAIIPAEWIPSNNPTIPNTATPNLSPIALYPRPVLIPNVTYYVVITPYANCVAGVNDVLWGRSAAGQVGNAYQFKYTNTGGIFTSSWSSATNSTIPFATFFRAGASGSLTATVEDSGSLLKSYARNSTGLISSAYEWVFAQANPNLLCRDDACFLAGIGTWAATNATVAPTSNSTTVAQPSTTAVAGSTTVASSVSTTSGTPASTTAINTASTTTATTLSTTAAVSSTTSSTPGSTTATLVSTTANSATALSATSATLTVVSTTGFPSAGGFRILSSYSGGTYYYVTYTSLTATTFVGCVIVAAQSSGSTYTTVVGNPIVVANASTNSTGTSQSTITVGTTTGLPAASTGVPATVSVLHGGTLYPVSYTGTTGTTLTGCSCPTLFTMTTGDSIFAGNIYTSSSSPINIIVASTSTFPSSGTMTLTNASGQAYITYTGTTATSFTGCYLTFSSAAGQYIGTNAIANNILNPIAPATLNVASNSGFPTSGNFTVGTTLVTYTGTNSTTQFTGCYVATGNYTVPAATAINNGVLSTTIASNFTLASVTGLPTSGTVNLVHTATNYTITYTGITGSSLTGCTSSTAVTASNADVVSNNFLSTLASTLTISGSTSLFPTTSGIFNLTHSGTNYAVTYTGTTSTQFTGCTIASSTVQASTGDSVFLNGLSTTASVFRVTSNTNFPTGGSTFYTTVGATPYYVTYTGVSGSTYLTGCTISSGSATVTSTTSVITNYLSNTTASTLTVASTTGFASSGTIYTTVSSTLYQFSYTGTNATQFTGVTLLGATANLQITAAAPIATEVLSTTSSTVTVASTSGFPTAGTLLLTHSSVGYLVTYTGTTGTTFTGCTIASGNVTIATGDTVTDDYIPASPTTTTLTVASVTGFPSSGTLVVTHSSTQYIVAYTGVITGSNEFTGCTATAGPVGLSTGDSVTVSNIVSLTPSTITVSSTAGFPSSGTVSVVHGGITYAVTYTNTASLQFLNSTIAAGSVTLTAGDAVSQSPLAFGTGYSLLVTASGSSPSTLTVGATRAYQVGVATIATFSAYALAASTGRSIQASLLCYFGNGTLVGTLTGTSVTDSTTGWTRIYVTGSIPSNTSYVIGQITVTSASANEVHYISNAEINPGVLGPWVIPGSGLASARTLSYVTNSNGVPVVSSVT